MQVRESNIEGERRDAMARYNIIDTAPEREFDDIVSMAARICGVPVALIAFIDNERMWFKAKTGTDLTEIPRKQSFCSYAVLKPDSPLIIENTLLDPQFVDNPHVTGGYKARFYAGVPIRNQDRIVLGTLCLLDNKPRTLTVEQIAALEALGRQINLLLDLRLTTAALQKAKAELSSHNLTDEATGLHNLSGFVLLASQQLELSRSRRIDESLWVMAADIDGLKSINNKYGRDEGIAAIKAAAGVIESTLTSSDILARADGDEFIVMIRAADSIDGDKLSDRVKIAIEEYNSHSGKPYILGVSLGVISVDEAPGATIEDIIKQAHEAVRQVKIFTRGG